MGSDIYSKIKEQRRDMTDWLIHFTKQVDKTHARDVLKKILLEGLLQPGFALRKSKGTTKKTVYGPNPAVCFSEQPIDSFLSYLNARKDQISGYGLLIQKVVVFNRGGFPAIYGLANTRELSSGESDYDSNYRLLDPLILPYNQQYRYVALSLGEGTSIDWTHEREWRWSSANNEPFKIFELGLNNRKFVHAFVQCNDDIEWLKNEINLALIPELSIFKTKLGDFDQDYIEEKLRKILKVKIISLEIAAEKLKHGDQRYRRFEEWPEGDKHTLVNDETKVAIVKFLKELDN